MPDAAGSPVEHRDGKGSLVVRQYADPLHRLTHLRARDHPGQPLTLRERLEYGDAGDPDQPDAERTAARAANLLGRLHRHHDEAGLVVYAGYDFTGNLTDKHRQVVSDAALAADWQPDWNEDDSQGSADTALGSTVYATTTRYDALNRPTAVTYPADVTGHRARLTPRYNRAGALKR